MIRPPPVSTLTDTRFPYTTVFRSGTAAETYRAAEPVAAALRARRPAGLAPEGSACLQHASARADPQRPGRIPVLEPSELEPGVSPVEAQPIPERRQDLHHLYRRRCAPSPLVVHPPVADEARRQGDGVHGPQAKPRLPPAHARTAAAGRPPPADPGG